MDMHQLASLVAIVDAGSISRAAVVMGLSQPSLSHQLALLEKDFGEALFVRTGRGVVPTEAGGILIRHARGILEATRQVRNELLELQSNPQGRIEIGLPPSLAQIFAVPLITMFRTRFPRATITVTEGLSIGLRDLLIAGRLDMALLFESRTDPQLDTVHLLREEMRLVGPPGAILPPFIEVKDLPNFPMVLPSSPNAIRRRVDAALEPGNLALNIVAEVGAVQTTIALVEAGVGYSIMPPSALVATNCGSALPTAFIAPPLFNNLILAQRANAATSRIARSTSEMLVSIVASHTKPTSTPTAEARGKCGIHRDPRREVKPA